MDVVILVGLNGVVLDFESWLSEKDKHDFGCVVPVEVFKNVWLL